MRDLVHFRRLFLRFFHMQVGTLGAHCAEAELVLLALLGVLLVVWVGQLHLLGGLARRLVRRKHLRKLLLRLTIIPLRVDTDVLMELRLIVPLGSLRFRLELVT